MAELMSDASMWTRSAALRDIMNPPAKASSSSAGTGACRKRRDDDELMCAHCERVVSELIYVNACTYECALRLAMKSRFFYDYVYTSIMSRLRRCDLAMPQSAMPMDDSVLSPEEYWRICGPRLYSDQPAMLQFLRERLHSNSVEPKSAGGEKRRRGH